MAENTSNSFRETMTQFMRLQGSAVKILEGLTESMTTSSEIVKINIKTEDGEEMNFELPSYGYITERIKRLDESMKKLFGLDSNTHIRLPDGTYRKIYQQNLPETPQRIQNLNVPEKFEFKNNWFFESMLSPALYIPVDVSEFIDIDDTKILIKRVILNTSTQEEIDIFNNQLNGRNDIEYGELVELLEEEGISFFIDEETEELPLSILRYEGSFDVYKHEDVEITIDDKPRKTRKYFLNKLTYTDNLSQDVDSKVLQKGDKLHLDQTIFEIIDVDDNNNAISVKTISGYDSIKIGGDILKIYPEKFNTRTAQVGIGFDERQVIFFKPVNSQYNIVSVNWSQGIGFYSNDLEINTEEGKINLSQFYTRYVSDFGQDFMNAAKEKMIPAVYGLKPNSPYIDADNLHVIQINEHKLSTSELKDIKQKAADKVRLNSEINELDKSINKKKEELTDRKFESTTERRGVENELDDLIEEKTSKSKLYSTIIEELAVFSQNKPSVLEKPKYRIRGYFDIPSPVYHEKTGNQYPIQFLIEYRYLKIDGSSAKVSELEYVTSSGVKLKGSFSNWTQIKSEIRKRFYDGETNRYAWQVEDVEDPDIININTIDIPITKGEKVEIRVRSISEAGWPLNPIMSDWSEGVIVDFPEELASEDEASSAIEEALKEEIRVKFQNDLNSMGLDMHLSRSLVSGDKYLAHDADQISSGFYLTDGKTVMTSYEKFKELTDEIKDLKAKVEKIKGTLVVSIVDDENNTHEVKNGDTISLFAGYYKDKVDDLPSSERKGAIINTVYKLKIENGEATPLELVSLLPGGIEERIPNTLDVDGSSATFDYVNESISPTDKDYNRARRYDLVPIVNNSIDPSETNTASRISSSSRQSQQLMSQFIYSRMSDIGLKSQNSLYKEGYDENGDYIERIENTYNPLNRCFLPDNDQTTGSPQTRNWVWNFGTGNEYENNGSPAGGGKLSGFCIHLDHPAINDKSQTSYDELMNPKITINGYIEDEIFGTIPTTDSSESFSEFIMSKYSNLRTGEKYIGTNSNKNASVNDVISQLNYRNNWRETGQTNWEDILGVSSNGISNLQFPRDIDHNDYNIADPSGTQYILPDKFGFRDNDRFLIGNMTCGAFLYLSPVTFEQLLVNGTDHRAVKLIEKGESKGLEIPVIFQYRMTDYYGSSYTGSGIIGGYDPDSNSQLTDSSKNVDIIYRKRMGIDIYTRDETVFSFDIDVNAKYRRESLIQKVDLTTETASKGNAMRQPIKKSQIKGIM